MIYLCLCSGRFYSATLNERWVSIIPKCKNILDSWITDNDH